MLLHSQLQPDYWSRQGQKVRAPPVFTVDSAAAQTLDTDSAQAAPVSLGAG